MYESLSRNISRVSVTKETGILSKLLEIIYRQIGETARCVIERSDDRYYTSGNRYWLKTFLFQHKRNIKNIYCP